MTANLERLGVLSDSHGRTASTRVAVATLVAAGATRLLYLGDAGSDAVLEELVAGLPVHVVFGNCDDDIALGRVARSLDFDVAHPAGTLDLAGHRVAFTHGHLPAPIDAAVGAADLLLVGHSHRIAYEAAAGGRTTVVNPGALFRAARYTAALIELRRSTSGATAFHVSWLALPPS